MRVLRTSGLGGRVALELPARGAAALIGLLLALLALLAASVASGTMALSPLDALAAIFGDAPERASLVAGDLRLPRALTALGAGGLLALSGALLQGATRNPLADPALVGVSQGAGLAVIALTILAPSVSDHWHAPAAFAGSLAVAALILALSRGSGDRQPVRFLLTGIGLAAFLTAATTALLTYGGVEEAHGALAWLSGSVRGAGWDEVQLMAFATPCAWAVALLAARPLAALRLGDELATTLGHRAGAARTLVICGAVALAAGSVAVVGPIAFVGLIAPHAASRLSPAGPGLHLALTWAMGAALTAGADLAARTLADPVQVPAGLVTALLGAPVFALLMLQRLRREIP